MDVISLHPITLAYYHSDEPLADTVRRCQHEAICGHLGKLKDAGLILGYSIQEQSQAFPTKEARQKVLCRLRDFSMRHHVGLGKIFGSNRYGFSYLPSSFLFVTEGEELREVFPCDISGTQFDAQEFLESLLQGEPWNRQLVPEKKQTNHETLIQRIVDNPNILEPGLTLAGRTVHLSRDFGEVGYVDLIFEDKEGLHLLVEVKVKSDEIDKAIGQVRRYRELYAKQNFVSLDKLRLGIACPSIPELSRATCQEIGIECFEIA